MSFFKMSGRLVDEREGYIEAVPVDVARVVDDEEAERARGAGSVVVKSAPKFNSVSTVWAVVSVWSRSRVSRWSWSW